MMLLPSCARSRGRRTKRKPPRLQQEAKKNNTPQSFDPTRQSVLSPSTFLATARNRQPTEQRRKVYYERRTALGSWIRSEPSAYGQISRTGGWVSSEAFV